MSALSIINPIYSVSGFAVGMLVGMTGVGGGSLMTPLLVLLFGIHPSTAVGTDLLYASITKTGGTAVHGLNKSVDWRIVFRLAAGSLPAAAITLTLLHIYGAPPNSTLITNSLGVALMLTAVSLIFRPWIIKWADGLGEVSTERTAVLTVVTGALLGALVTLSSVGAGALGVTALILLYPKLPTVRIVGSDIAHAVPLTLVAGLGHLWLGSVNGVLLLSLLVGSIPGILIGSQFSTKIPDGWLRPIMAATLLLVGGRMLVVF
jgi:uncharacterized membrane protein YfcA